MPTKQETFDTVVEFIRRGNTDRCPLVPFLLGDRYKPEYDDVSLGDLFFYEDKKENLDAVSLDMVENLKEYDLELLCDLLYVHETLYPSEKEEELVKIAEQHCLTYK